MESVDLQVSKVPNWVKALAAKSKDIRSTPGNHMVEGEQWLFQVVLWSWHTHCGAYVSTHIQQYTRDVTSSLDYIIFYNKGWWNDVFHFLNLPGSCMPTWDRFTLVISGMSMRTHGKIFFLKINNLFFHNDVWRKKWLFMSDWQCFPVSQKYSLHNIYGWQDKKIKKTRIYFFCYGEICKDYCVCKPLCLPLAFPRLKKNQYLKYP